MPRGSFTSVSFFSFVRGRQIKIGDHVQIGAATFIDTPIIFKNMVSDMIPFFQGTGLRCEGLGADGTIFRAKKSGCVEKKGWRLHVVFGSPEEKPMTPLFADVDVLLSFDRFSAEDRSELDARHVTWFDFENKEASYVTNDLGEEVALFLRRYGIRFFRVSVF